MVAIFLLLVAVLVTFPAISALRERGRAASGARHMAGEFQRMRWQSVARRKGRGLLFEREGRGWTWRVVEDGNGNGLRTTEVRRGVDPLISGPHRLEDIFEHTKLGFPPGGPFPRIPPKRGTISNTDDPIQFGRSDLIGFSPLGDSSSGTLYVTDGREGLYAVVLFGPTVRVRVWRYDYRGRKWIL